MGAPRIDIREMEGRSSSTVHRTAVEPSVGRSDEVRREEIELQLDRILASSSFRNSRRHTQFLRYIVEKALSGKISEIKERLIGIEIFERPPDYDMTADPIVRGAAAELRKRIAQYYADPAHANELRLDLPLGSYAPIFHWPSQVLQQHLESTANESSHTTSASIADVAPVAPLRGPISSSKSRIFKISVLLFALIAVAAIGTTLAIYFTRANSDQHMLEKFWAPLLNGSDSITVCVGDLNYFFKTPPVSDILQLHPMADNLLNPNVGTALLRVGTILGARGKRSTLRLADLTELNDLRQQPVIFIGGMNNPWTQRILAGLRFRMTNKPGGIGGDYSLVVDQENPSKANWRVDIRAPLDSIDRDYSLITRMNDPLTGEPIVILSGLGPYGTSAASEFVSNPDYFSQFSKQAPKGWEDHNIQIVLAAKVVNGLVSVPRVVAEQIY